MSHLFIHLRVEHPQRVLPNAVTDLLNDKAEEIVQAVLDQGIYKSAEVVITGERT